MLELNFIPPTNEIKWNVHYHIVQQILTLNEKKKK